MARCTSWTSGAEGAWESFEAENHVRYVDLVAATAHQAAGLADVVVIAQATMADAAESLAGLAVPVLSSPRLAIKELVGLAAHADLMRRGHDQAVADASARARQRYAGVINQFA